MSNEDLIRNIKEAIYNPRFTNALKVDTVKTLVSSYEGVKNDNWIS